MNVVDTIIVLNELLNTCVSQPLRWLRLPAENSMIRDGLIKNMVALLLAKCYEKYPVTISSRDHELCPVTPRFQPEE
jgi:hypothetical protein